MNIYVSQQSIVSKLKTEFETLGVRWKASDLPEAQNQYQIAVPNETVWVVYHGSNAALPNTTRVVAQERKVSFSIDVYSRTLYDENGVMTIRDVIEQALVGFAPANCQRLYLIKDELTITDDRIWAHVLQFECVTMLVQKDESDPIIIPAFKELVNND